MKDNKVMIYKIWDKKEKAYFSKDFHKEESFPSYAKADQFAFDWLQEGNYPDYAQSTVLEIHQFEITEKFIRAYS